MYQGQAVVSTVPPNFAVERTAGAHFGRRGPLTAGVRRFG
jgi:hypothetical protein